MKQIAILSLAALLPACAHHPKPPKVYTGPLAVQHVRLSQTIEQQKAALVEQEQNLAAQKENLDALEGNLRSIDRELKGLE